MKKFLIFAGILAFMSCSSDDSNGNPVITEPPVLPITSKNILVVGNDYLAQVDFKTGEVNEINVDNAHFEFPAYDDAAKKLYDLSKEHILTLDFNTKKLTKREFAPGFVEYMEGMTMLDGKGNLLTYFYSGFKHLGYSSFYKINIDAATNRIENGSQKLNSMLTSKEKSIFSYQLNNKKDKLYALYQEDLGQGKAKYSMLILNPNDLEDYDEDTEKKTIALPASFGTDKNSFGFFIDKDDNLLFVTSDNRLVKFDLITKKETELYKFEKTFIGDVVYDKTTHNIYFLLLDKEDANGDSKYTKLAALNLSENIYKERNLVFKKEHVLELSSLLMVDPF